MRANRLEKVVGQNGVLELKALPFREGEVVEVIILSREVMASEANPEPVKGKVLKYENPTEPVAQEDWDILP